MYAGCPRCYVNHQQKLAGGRTASELHNSTQARLRELEGKGLKLDVKWECDFRKELNANPALKEQYDGIALPSTPLQPRKDALRGGRVEAFKLYHKCEPDEEILHLDVVGHFKD